MTPDQRIEGIESYEGLSEGWSATGVVLAFAGGRMMMNFMPPAGREAHLQGFEGYARKVIDDCDTRIHALARIRHIRRAIGSVIDRSGRDDEVRGLPGPPPTSRRSCRP